MKLMPYSLGVLSLALLALLAPPSAAVPGADPTTAAAPGAATRQHTASQIGTFLTTFYGDHGPSAFDRRYRISSVLQERQVLSPDGDVLLCAQNQPKDIGIGPVTVGGGRHRHLHRVRAPGLPAHPARRRDLRGLTGPTVPRRPDRASCAPGRHLVQHRT